MRSALCLALVAAVHLISSCKQRCEGEFDCHEGSYCSREHSRCQIDCFTHDDCRRPVECRANENNCVPKGLFCSQRGQCVGRVGDRPPPEDASTVLETLPDGWELPAGDGHLFVMSSLQMGGMGVGFDLDGIGGIDNVLHAVSGDVNPSLQSGILSGHILILLEIAGLDLPYDGWDDSVTLKIYGGIDADYPADSFNNFELPPSREGRCCEFNIDTAWTTIVEDRQQATTLTPAKIENFRLYAPKDFPHHTFDIQFLLTIGAAPYYYVNIANSRIEFDLDSDLTRLRNGILGGGLTANSLAAISNPFCGSQGVTCPSGDPESTLLDLTSYLAGPSPDIDVDGDGRECALDTGTDRVIDLCCEGASAMCRNGDRVCPGDVIQSATPNPADCARSTAFTDGYSTAFLFGGVKATLVGFSGR